MTLHFRNPDNTRGEPWNPTKTRVPNLPTNAETAKDRFGNLSWPDAVLSAQSTFPCRTYLQEVNPQSDTYDDSEPVWQGTHWVITRTHRAYTQEELDARKDVKTARITDDAMGKLHKLELAGIFWLARQHNPALTLDEFLTNLNTYAAQFPDDKFRAKVREFVNA